MVYKNFIKRGVKIIKKQNKILLTKVCCAQDNRNIQKPQVKEPRINCERSILSAITQYDNKGAENDSQDVNCYLQNVIFRVH